MNLNLLFWSETKVNILKYLLFKKDKISARELESNIQQSFSAIKKQVDSLCEAGIIDKNKKWNRRQLAIKDDFKELIYSIFIYDIKNYFNELAKTNSYFLKKYFLLDFFSYNNDVSLWTDIVFVYKDVNDKFLEDIKKQISSFLDLYYFDLKISFMEETNYQKRLRFADKFIIKLNKYESFTF